MPVVATLLILLKKSNKEEIRLLETSEEEAIKICVERARSLRVAERGKGVKLSVFYKKIKCAERLVYQKIRNKEQINEAEKWLYENFRYAYKGIFENVNVLKDLPTIDGVPRIVILARTIVAYSLGDLTHERIGAIMNKVKDVLTLEFREAVEFRFALRYALVEQIYVLAERILKADEMKRSAVKGKLRKDLLKNDTYLYYLIENKRFTEVLLKMGVDDKRVMLSYNDLLMQNMLTAKTLFTALSCCDELFTPEEGVKILQSYAVLERKIDLKSIDYETLISYFRLISFAAKKSGVSEEFAAKILLLCADTNRLDVSVILYDHLRSYIRAIKNGKYKISVKKSSAKEKKYVALSVISTVLICGAIYYFLRLIWLPILSFIPLLFICDRILFILLTSFGRQKECPKLKLRTIPNVYASSIVISAFCGGTEELSELLFRAESLLAMNKEEHVNCVLLVDSPSSGAPVSDTDKNLKDYFMKHNRNDKIILFLRRKKFDGKKYVSIERKRGAFLALCKFFVEKNNSEFYYISDENIKSPTFIVALDTDNRILPGGVKDLVERIAHPYNSKFNILSTSNRIDLFSIKTLYAKRFVCDAGFEGYPFYSGALYKVFGKDFFCGKGIIRLKEFYNALNGLFPCGKILSHDIPEGAIVGCGSGGTTFEEAPKGFLSQRTRQKRWACGDVQNLPFILGRWKSEDGSSVRIKIPLIYRYGMLKNILALLLPVSIVLIFFIGLCSNIWGIFVGSVLFLIPYSIDFILTLRMSIEKTSLSYIFKRIADVFFNASESFFMLLYNAVSDLSVLIITFGRMILNKDLLVWKTFSQSEKESGFVRYVKEFIPVIAAYVILISVLFFMGRYLSLIYFGAYVFLSVLCFLMLYLLSETSTSEIEIDDEGKKKLLSYAQSTYNYFLYMKRDNRLVGDNLQINPYKGICEYTSSTDIGFSILADVCAIELGFTDEQTGAESIMQTLEIIKKLPKWYGNLYNWYYIDSLKQTNDFVSSVDEGNFLISLYVVKSYFCGKNNKIVETVTTLIEESDIGKLYDENKRQFYIGYDGRYQGHYDMLCSEARILSMVYVMKYGRTDNYFALSREYTPRGNNTLLSWGGSAFETLLPELFFVSPNDSVLKNSVRQMCYEQLKNKFDSMWGVSESGYASFDPSLRFQYKCFGIPSLSVSSDTNNAVISPYSSFLCLAGSGSSVIKNLYFMEKKGLYGEYGFYESIDFEHKGKIVYQYMTHHQGMILCAVAERLSNGFMSDLLYSTPEGFGANILFNEKPTVRRVRYPVKTKGKVVERSENSYDVGTNKVATNPVTAAVTDGNARLIMNANGGNFFAVDQFYLQKKREEYTESGGAYFFVKKNNVLVSPTFLPLCDGSKTYRFHFDGREATYFSDSDRISESVRIIPGLNGCLYRLDCEKETEVYFYSDICMNSLDAYTSHPTFSDMFIHSQWISEDTVLFCRRGKTKKYVVVRVSGAENVVFNTNRMFVLGRCRDLSDPLFNFDADPSFGDVLNPCLSFRANIKKSGFCCVTLLAGNNKSELLSEAASLPYDTYLFSKQCNNPYLLQQNTIENLSIIMYVINNKNKNGVRFLNNRIICKVDSEKDIERYIGFYEELLLLRVRSVLSFVSSDWNETVRKMCEGRIDYRIDKEEPIKESSVKNDEYYVRRFDESQEEISCPTIDYPCGNGGFDTQGNYICFGHGFPEHVYSHIIAGEKGGSLVTTMGGGFFWFGNSRENKVIRFDNDPVSESKGEWLSVFCGGKRYSLLGGKGKARYSELGKGFFCHYLKTDTVAVKTMITSIFDGRARVIDISVSDIDEAEYSLSYACYPCLSSSYEKGKCFFDSSSGIVRIKNRDNGNEVYFSFVGCGNESIIDENSSFPNVTVKNNNSFRYYLVFSPDKELIGSLTKDNIPIYVESFIAKNEEISSIDIIGGGKGLEKIISFLPYQIIFSRLYARAGFYQVGGAYGFRDQLQDAMALFNQPELLRKQILVCCAHQYEEGDVMHWWHPPKMGLRSRITDDKLFLPMAVIRYISVSGDTNILNIDVEYVKSKTLDDVEKSRYEYAENGIIEPVFKHCLRAIKSALKYGEHRLLIMGTGDWNDGMDEICQFGKGESVFNSMLAYYVLKQFGEICPEDLKKELFSIAVELKDAINTYGFDDDRYLRLYTDDGRWMGNKGNKTLELDLLVQSIAVLSGVAEGERAEKVLDTCKTLIDKEYSIIKLLYPAQTGKDRIGYISDYPPGIRENGGQYTHAAIWYLTALCRVGRQDEAFEYFCMLNPAVRCSTEDGNKRYKGEPYVFSGDVYSNPSHMGECGWSWYTGSAAWAYRLVCEEFFGLKRRGSKLYIEPSLPTKLDGCTLTYRYRNSVYLIEYHFGLRPKMTVDGIESEYVDLKDGCNCSVYVEIGL